MAPVEAVVHLTALRIGQDRLQPRARPSRARPQRTSSCSPAPAAASIAAPRAVVSTSSGRVTGSPVTSARIWRSRSPRAPPATHTTSVGDWPAAPDRLQHVAQRERVALQQRPRQVRAAVRRRQPEPAARARRRSTPAPSPRPARAPTARRPAPGRRALRERVEQLVDVAPGGAPPAPPRPSPARRGTSGRRRRTASPGSPAASRRDRRAGAAR